MKSPIGEYKDRSQRKFDKHFREQVIQAWEKMAPDLTKVDMIDMILRLQSSFCHEDDKHLLTQIIVLNFQEAYDEMNNEGIIQNGSLLLYSFGCTLEEFSIITERSVSRRQFTLLNYHIDNVGAGKPMPDERIDVRNHDHRVNIIREFVILLLRHGIYTAKVKKKKG